MTAQALPKVGSPPEFRYDTAHYLLRIFTRSQLTVENVRRLQSVSAGSDRGFVRFLAIDPITERVVARPALRRLSSIKAFLRRIDQSTVNVYLCPNGYWSAGVRDGHPIPGWRFTNSNLRWLNAVTVDLDAKNFHDHELQALWYSDRHQFLARLHEELQTLGVRNYLVVQTNPKYGLQVHVLLKPLRANHRNGSSEATTTDTWRSVSAALYARLARWGADCHAAKRPGQVFRIPGVSRPSYDGYRVELLVDCSDGPRASLFDLLGRLRAEGLVAKLHAKTTLPPRPGRVPRRWGLLYRVIQDGGFQGLAKGQGRRTTAYLLALALRAEALLHFKGEDVPQMVATGVRLWNQRNTPPLPADVVEGSIRSALAGSGRVTLATWLAVCRALGVQLPHPCAFTPARERHVRQRDHVQEVESDMLRLLVAGSWRGVQSELPAAVERVAGEPVALRTVQLAMARMRHQGLITLETRRGRGGYTEIALTPAGLAAAAPLQGESASSQPVDINPHTPNAGAKAPAGPRLAKTVGGWGGAPAPVLRAKSGAAEVDRLVAMCRQAFGAEVEVTVCDEDPGERARRWTRGTGPAGLEEVVAAARVVRYGYRMRELLEAAAELMPAGGFDAETLAVVDDLHRRLEGLEARRDLRREWAAWRALQEGRITLEEVGWLVARHGVGGVRAVARRAKVSLPGIAGVGSITLRAVMDVCVARLVELKGGLIQAELPVGSADEGAAD